MHPRTIPVKRRPASTGFFKRFNAVTRHRNQRAATATASPADLSGEDSSERISRGFTIIVLFHVAAIALYFVHLKWLNSHSVEAPAAVAAATPVQPAARAPRPVAIAPGDATYQVQSGDYYARIAAREGVSESALRAANNDVTISAGLTLKLPPRTTETTDHGTANSTPPDRSQPPGGTPRGTSPTTPADAGLVAAQPVTDPPRAIVVQPRSARNPATQQSPPASRANKSGKSYVVKSGDNLWRIAKNMKVDQDSLMRANGITDPKKLKTGMTLVMPN